MPKAYWIARVNVLDPDPYALYAAGASEAFKEFGARVLARGGPYAHLEGEERARNVVVEFDSLEQAKNCYASATYQTAKAHRQGVAEADIVIVEGV